MKKKILCLYLFSIPMICFCQNLVRDSKLNVEKLNGTIDLNQDISQYSLSDVRILRNAFAARQGYCFMSADLRGIFSTTSWYETLMEKRFWDEEEYAEDGNKNTNRKMAPISYTKEEQAFIAKLKTREEELRKENFNVANGDLVNVANLVNPFQLSTIPQVLQQKLAKNGFAINPGVDDQLFHIYERNDYHNFPNFVTTDLFLQAFHMYFDCVLRDVEQTKFIPTLIQFTHDLYKSMRTLEKNGSSKEQRAAAAWCSAYFSIAHALLTGETPLPVSDSYTALVKEEINHVKQAETSPSEFLGYTPAEMMPNFIYNTYRPRGHYTRNETLKRYFMGMMWLQNAPFNTEKPQQMRRALLMAHVIGKNTAYTHTYQSICEPITFLMGQPDNVDILQVYGLMNQRNYQLGDYLDNEKGLKKITHSIVELAKKQTRIVPVFAHSGKWKINLMPQRYMPDAEVLQDMVDYEGKPTKRGTPKGLDVLAAIGIPAAEKVLLEELKEGKNWSAYTTNLDKMKQSMKEVDWKMTVANQWINALKDVNSVPEQAPYFMQTPAWDKKNLNTALASWAELKHDAILYAKQPMGAECGGYGPPEPVTKGYVEPNVAYWQKAIDLIDATTTILKKFDFVTEKVQSVTEELRDRAEFLLNISKKELSHQSLSQEEYNQIELIGSSFEYITLDLIREPDQYLSGWDNVHGADKKVAVVADVYTANADNNPEKSVLYEAVGPAHEIYVIVEIDGYLYLTRGAILSYREFQKSLDTPRLTDEEWQQQLEQQPNQGIPSWMEPLLLPFDGGKKLDNESIFYSSGC